MKYSHIFLDFDETLFDHDAYFAWADKVLTERFAVSAGSFAGQTGDYHDVVAPLMRLYRHSDHIEDVTKRSWQFMSGELEHELRESGLDFCYPETHETLRWLVGLDAEVRILTFGHGEYQRYKINTCPVLHELRIPVHVVNQAKADFLATEFGDIGHGVLVDDKHPLNLPAKWDEVWIDRKGKHEASMKISDKTYKISSLKQLRKLVT